MMLDLYKAKHIKEAVHYGVQPLNHDQLSALWLVDASLDCAYSVACDLGAGFSFDEAFRAFESNQGAK